MIRGRAGDTGDERVVWLSSTEIADRMRALAGELAALEARLSASSRYTTAEDQRAALLQASGFVEASLGRWSRHLAAEAERVAGRDDGTSWTSPDLLTCHAQVIGTDQVLLRDIPEGCGPKPVRFSQAERS